MKDLFAPQVGAIYWCRFPEDETVFCPGKVRPVLLLDTSRREDGQMEVLVAYGTSQKLDLQHKGEFLYAVQAEGLTVEGKFRLGKRRWLPVTNEYFRSNPSLPKGTPVKIGVLPKEYMRMFHRAAEEAGLI